MQNLQQRIADNQKLSDEAKEKLQKIYDSIKCKNVIQEAFDSLQLNTGADSTEIYDYRMAFVELLKITDTVKNKELGDILETLFNFFDILYGDDFDTLRRLDYVLGWCKDEETEANKFYDQHINKL